MLFKNLSSEIDVDDDEFDIIYPEELRNISYIHFTPIDVSKVAAKFLVKKDKLKVLDIGSGTGKFCMVGAACTKGRFYGIENREHLTKIAIKISKKYKLNNVEFICANINSIDFKNYDAFYFYNSFYENICEFEEVIDEVEINNHLYESYSNYVKKQLEKMPIGTRLATYYSSRDIAPDSFHVIKSDFDEKLKLWEKVE